MTPRKILLLEPNFKNKYPPMGLMKLATYYRTRNDDVRFFKGDLLKFAASLLLEEFLFSADNESPIDRALLCFIAKRGPVRIIEFITSGKHSTLEFVVQFSRSFDEFNALQLNSFLERLAVFRKRYKNEDYPKFDFVCVSTLFTFYWKETVETIQFAKKFCSSSGKVFVGGIASTLVPQYIEKETGIVPHLGLLSQPYIFDNDENGNVIIDELPLDYSILEEVDYKYPTENAYFGYMTRGCVNRCSFCAVPKLEPAYRNYIDIKRNIKIVEECFGPRKDLLLMDNNVFASNRFDDVIDDIKCCGFGAGASYVPMSDLDIAFRNLCSGFFLNGGNCNAVFNDRAYIKKIIKIYDVISDRIPDDEEKGWFYQQRENLGLLFYETARKDNIIKFHDNAKRLYDKHFKPHKRIRFIDFNQGLDARLATEENMSKLSEVAIRPLRVAFDQWSIKSVYEKAIRLAAKNGIKDLSNYLLYNFKDHPDDLYKRMRLNVDLCEELSVTIYSFPMKYHPIDDPLFFHNRDYIGAPHWNRKFIRAIQAVLNSTHGKIGRGKSFFEAAFGADLDEFRKILWMPEALIIQRYKYDKQKRIEYFGDKKTPYDEVDDVIGSMTSEWWSKFSSLNPEKRLIAEKIIANNDFNAEKIDIQDKEILDVLWYYQIPRDGKR